MGRADKIRQKSTKRSLRIPYTSILIITEGRNIEPSYFHALKQKYRLQNITIDCSHGCTDAQNIVKYAHEQKKEYDEIWCVFDCDISNGSQTQKDNFDKAIRKAESKGINIAYSNQSFEYWILLHFNDHQGGRMSRIRYKNAINTALLQIGLQYNDNGKKIISSELFQEMEKRQKAAIDRAKRNDTDHTTSCITYHGRESNTTVYKLVERILDLIKEK